MNARRIKVLIADYHEGALLTFKRLLEDSGYDTATAWTGCDALKAMRGHVFDLVLVNEYLPDVDAEDFIPEVQRRGGNVPCVVMQPSATQITDISRFFAAGAVAVVCKWSQTKVLETVHALVSPTRTMRPQQRIPSA
jgi:CheY-like chemotaxis protein